MNLHLSQKWYYSLQCVNLLPDGSEWAEQKSGSSSFVFWSVSLFRRQIGRQIIGLALLWQEICSKFFGFLSMVIENWLSLSINHIFATPMYFFGNHQILNLSYYYVNLKKKIVSILENVFSLSCLATGTMISLAFAYFITLASLKYG